MLRQLSILHEILGVLAFNGLRWKLIYRGLQRYADELSSHDEGDEK